MSKRFSTDLPRVSTSQLKSLGAFDDGIAGFLELPSRQGSESRYLYFQCQLQRLILTLTESDGFKISEQIVRMSEEPCHFGGSRTWIHCPERDCGMRVLVLYLIGVSWKCRQCADLKYRSQHVAKIPRLLAKARRLRDRLGAGSEIFQDFPPRPLGMHKWTYIESIEEIFKLEYSILQLRRREIEQIMTDCRGCRWGSKQSLDDHWTNISELIYTEGKDE